MKFRKKSPSKYSQFYALSGEIETELAKIKANRSANITENINEQLDDLEKKVAQRDKLGEQLIKSSMNARLISTILSFIFVTISLIFNYHGLVSIATHVDKTYYEAVVGFIPVFLIAMYIGDSGDNKIEHIKDLISELLSLVVPALLGVVASLIALAVGKSNGILFILTIYSIILLSFSFIQRISNDAIAKAVLSHYTKKSKS